MTVEEANIPPDESEPLPGARSLVTPFNRAGSLSLLDLGFDAENGSHHSSDEDGQDSGSDIVGFPGERVSHVSFGFEGERWRLRNVAWVLAQSASGQKLLDLTYRAGYRISFDRMAFSGERLECLTNLQDKCIALDPRTPPPMLLINLTTQLVAAANASNGLVLDLTLTPPAALLANRLVMADAEAAVLQITWELRQSTTLPAKANREIYWETARQRQPALAATFEAHAQSAMSLESGMAAAAVIRAVYQSPKLRERSENEVLQTYRALPPSLFKDPKFMIIPFNDKDISYKFALAGVGYALSHEPKLDLSDSLNKGIFSASQDVLNLLQSARRNAGVKDREVWNLPVVQMTDFSREHALK